MAINNLAATETPLWVCESRRSASNHQEDDRDRKTVGRLSWADSPRKEFGAVSP